MEILKLRCDEVKEDTFKAQFLEPKCLLIPVTNNKSKLRYSDNEVLLEPEKLEMLYDFIGKILGK